MERLQYCDLIEIQALFHVIETSLSSKRNLVTDADHVLHRIGLVSQQIFTSLIVIHRYAFECKLLTVDLTVHSFIYIKMCVAGHFV